MKKAILVILAIAFVLNLNAQNVKTIRRTNGNFYEEYLAQKSDTSIKDGRYLKKYKHYIIERGAYKNNKKFGRWLYFSLEGFFEFEYDYNSNKVIKITTRRTPEEYMETPILFHGSPIIPYLYMVRNIRYPATAKNKNITGKIVLAIHINKNGRVTSLFLKKKLHPLLDKEVMNVAKTMPMHWQWIPATYHGKNINSEYLIDIEFELTSDDSI